jgi:hypothetical protein
MQIGLDDIAAWHQQQAGNTPEQQQQQSKQPAAASADDSTEVSSSNDGPRDWKGEPMKLNPGGWYMLGHRLGEELSDKTWLRATFKFWSRTVCRQQSSGQQCIAHCDCLLCVHSALVASHLASACLLKAMFVAASCSVA